MAVIKYRGTIEQIMRNEEDRIRQGDYVFCRAVNGVKNFWGIYSADLKSILCLDGAGRLYHKGDHLYLHDTIDYWIVAKRISCEKAKIYIEES